MLVAIDFVPSLVNTLLNHKNLTPTLLCSSHCPEKKLLDKPNRKYFVISRGDFATDGKSGVYIESGYTVPMSYGKPISETLLLEVETSDREFVDSSAISFVYGDVRLSLYRIDSYNAVGVPHVSTLVGADPIEVNFTLGYLYGFTRLKSALDNGLAIKG